MPVKSIQYRGTVRVFNNLNFTMIRHVSRCLGKFSPNFLVIFRGFFVRKFFHLYSYLLLNWFSPTTTQMVPYFQKWFCNGLQYTTVTYISYLGSLLLNVAVMFERETSCYVLFMRKLFAIGT